MTVKNTGCAHPASPARRSSTGSGGSRSPRGSATREHQAAGASKQEQQQLQQQAAGAAREDRQSKTAVRCSCSTQCSPANVTSDHTRLLLPAQGQQHRNVSAAAAAALVRLTLALAFSGSLSAARTMSAHRLAYLHTHSLSDRVRIAQCILAGLQAGGKCASSGTGGGGGAACSLEVGHARHAPVCGASWMMKCKRLGAPRQAGRACKQAREAHRPGGALTGAGCRRGRHCCCCRLLRPRSQAQTRAVRRPREQAGARERRGGA